MYIVELFIDNEWVKHSYHKNLEHATFNMEVAVNGRKCPCRIIHHGKIINEHNSAT